MAAEMAKSINRRQFLQVSYLPTSRSQHLKPPWSLPQLEFVNNCTRCSDCIDICPENILVHDNNDFPKIDFNLGGCTFCEKCVDVCGDNAFYQKNENTVPWTHKVSIGKECISLHGVTCRACGDSCEWAAITFHHELGGIVRPEVDMEHCTGCGFCIYVCPVSAVSTKTNDECEDIHI